MSLRHNTLYPKTKHWNDVLGHELNGFDELQQIYKREPLIRFNPSNPFNPCSNKYSRVILWLGIVLYVCSR